MGGGAIGAMALLNVTVDQNFYFPKKKIYNNYYKNYKPKLLLPPISHQVGFWIRLYQKEK